MARFTLASLAAVTSLLPLTLAGCTEDSVVTAGNRSGPGIYGTGGGGGADSGASVGETCASAKDCRPGLACDNDTCALGHATEKVSPCMAAGDCTEGLKCLPGKNPDTKRPGNVCASPDADAGPEGAACAGDAHCLPGLRCGIVGFGAQCVPEGTKDVGQGCALSGDCFGGLICAPGTPASADAGTPATPSTCVPIPAGGTPFGVPTPPEGLGCEKATTDSVAAYFEVPGARDTAPGGDFFRLPFPNDARITNGKIDLKGFPTPGSFLLGFDPVQIYVDAITENESGWGAYPTTFFRFSGPIDFDTFSAGSGKAPLHYLDITDPANPGNGGAVWTYSGSNGKYICHDWLAVRRPEGAPLVPGHVYTVFLTTEGLDKSGRQITRSPELVALLDPAAPSDPALANAHAAYRPLRDYLDKEGFPRARVLNAAVFTVGKTRAPMQALAAAAIAGPVPEASGWVKCGGGAKSPCPQADGARACGESTADYDEYHALVAVPIFQKGTAPYLESGGDVAAKAVRTEKICAALTVPKTKTGMPAAGFPIAVFGHGTGGSFRDHVRAEVAGALARATPAMAVLGYDQVQHGPRRGESTASPNNLFFNFKNPGAARGNPLQGAVDVVSMGRFAASLIVPRDVTGAADVKTDRAGVVFFGHSQGSMHGSLGLPFTNDYSAAVLSGNGASLMHSLLSKTSPENIAAAVPFALGGDFDSKFRLAGGEMHPVLTLLQQWIDPADPVNFARAIGREAEPGILPKSVFQTYGLGDTFSPPVTLRTYAIAGELAVATHDPSVTGADSIADRAEQVLPLSGNFTPEPSVSGATPVVPVTLAVREYQNAEGNDGHLVAFDVPSANRDVVRFLSMAAAGKLPEVGAK